MEITDTLRLEFLMQDIDSYFKVKKDKYDYAIDVAEENGREVPIYSDDIEGFRRLVDEAMRVHKYIRK